MSGEYALGNSHFWVFLAVSVTLIGLIFGITYTLRFWNKGTSGGFFRALREGERPSPYQYQSENDVKHNDDRC